MVWTKFISKLAFNLNLRKTYIKFCKAVSFMRGATKKNFKFPTKFPSNFPLNFLLKVDISFWKEFSCQVEIKADYVADGKWRR